jgi:ferredoxin
LQIEVLGLASGRRLILSYEANELQQNLLKWLRGKGVTVASSCDGEGVCKKCDIQNGWLSCQMTLEEFLQRQPDGEIRISYL